MSDHPESPCWPAGDESKWVSIRAEERQRNISNMVSGLSQPNLARLTRDLANQISALKEIACRHGIPLEKAVEIVEEHPKGDECAKHINELLDLARQGIK